MAKNPIVGSWHNSGFHGHFRSKSRSDIYCEYRQLAKPQPPTEFLRRIKEPTSSFVFSKHDNRNAFPNQSVFQAEGLGRKRFVREASIYKPDLLTWMPHKEEFDRSAPTYSTYAVSFRGNPPQPLEQHLFPKPKTSFDEDWPFITSYRYAHCRDNPNRDIINAMSNVGLRTGTASIKKPPVSRDSVASCLAWSVTSKQPKADLFSFTKPLVSVKAEECGSATMAGDCKNFLPELTVAGKTQNACEVFCNGTSSQEPIAPSFCDSKYDSNNTLCNNTSYPHSVSDVHFVREPTLLTVA